MADEVALGRALISSGRPSAPYAEPAKKVTAVALSQSSKGKVTIQFDNDEYPLEVDTNVFVRKNDIVQVLIQNNIPIVIGVIGGGDADHEDIEVVADRYTITSSAIVIQKYTDGSYEPMEITFRSFVQRGRNVVKEPYEGVFVVSASVDGQAWSEIGKSEGESSILVSVLETERLVPGFQHMLVTLFSESEETPGLLIEQYYSTVSVVEANENYLTKKASGLYIHELEGSDNYNKDSNMRLSYDGIELRQGSEPYAKFGRDKIELGKNNSTAEIDLLNGGALIHTLNYGTSDNEFEIKTPYYFRLNSTNGPSVNNAWDSLISLGGIVGQYAVSDIGSVLAVPGQAVIDAGISMIAEKGVGARLVFRGTPNFNTPIPLTSGGFGGTTAAQARTNIGLANNATGRNNLGLAIAFAKCVRTADYTTPNANWINTLGGNSYAQAQGGCSKNEGSKLSLTTASYIQIAVAGYYRLQAGARYTKSGGAWAPVGLSLWDGVNSVRYGATNGILSESGSAILHTPGQIFYLPAGARIYIALYAPTGTVIGAGSAAERYTYMQVEFISA